MHELTKRTVQKLLTETDHVLVVEDFDCLERLDKLACKVTDPTESENAQILAAPYYVGGIAIKPITIGTAKYIDTVLRDMCAEDEDLFAIALGWAMTKPSTELWNLWCDQVAAIKEINSFWNGCQWRTDEMEGLLLWAFNTDADGNGVTDYGAVVGLLCREYNATPDYWLHEASAAMVSTMLNDWSKRQEEEKDQARKQAAKNHTHINVGITLKGIAMHKFNMAEVELRAQWLTT